MNLIETIIKKGKDLIDTATLTRKLRISRDEHLLRLEKDIIWYETHTQEYIKAGDFSNALAMHDLLKLREDDIQKANDFWKFINKDNK